MRLKKLFFAVVMCLSVAGCSEPEVKSYSSPQESSAVEKATVATIADETISYDVDIPENEIEIEKNFEGVPDADKGPQITIGNTKARAGEIAEVKISVTGADLAWSMCGIHITYPDILECVYQENDNTYLEYKAGDASEHNTGIVAMEWKKEKSPPEVLTSKNLGNMFFTIMFSGNDGKDGEIITLYLKIPEDAKSGTVYPIGYYYMASDMFRDMSGDKSLEKYAFKHIKNGSITVE